MPVELRRIVVYEIWVRLREGFETSFGVTLERPALIVGVEERGGEVGWAEVVAGEGPWYSCETYATAWHVIRDYLLPLMPREAEARGLRSAFARVRGHEMARAGLEMALWDLEARLEGRPLWRYIGGVRDRIESGVSVGIQPSAVELLRVVGRYLDEGYRRVKLKIKPGWDLEPVAAVRREYPDLQLQVDANAAYTLADSLHLKRLDDYDLLMIEQPLHWRDLVDHAELARLLRTPICLDESIHDAEDARRAYRLDAARVINIKPGRVGGIGESLEIHNLWYGRFGRPVWIGGMLETGVGRGHLVALATLPGVKYPNDISASSRYYEEDIVEPPWELNSDGTITAPERPGIGVEILMDRVEALARRRLVWRPGG